MNLNKSKTGKIMKNCYKPAVNLIGDRLYGYNAFGKTTIESIDCLFCIGVSMNFIIKIYKVHKNRS